MPAYLIFIQEHGRLRFLTCPGLQKLVLTQGRKEMTQQIRKILQELGSTGGRTRAPSGSTSHPPRPLQEL